MSGTDKTPSNFTVTYRGWWEINFMRNSPVGLGLHTQVPYGVSCPHRKYQIECCGRYKHEEGILKEVWNSNWWKRWSRQLNRNQRERTEEIYRNQSEDEVRCGRSSSRQSSRTRWLKKDTVKEIREMVRVFKISWDNVQKMAGNVKIAEMKKDRNTTWPWPLWYLQVVWIEWST
jgi:hypothetical protein